ncbi:MAG TPA: sialate O-acetylesterase [Pyrinomonadaceae bacterium]|nr:sialate O-acetylesterase [Pyrinomonadaceae bacterium]
MKIFLPALVLVFSTHLFAEVQIPDIIGSDMVLQQRRNVPIWGTAEPGESVTVNFAGQTKTVVTGVDGKWRVELAPLHASSRPQEMTIEGKNTIRLTGILVGEVWLVAGQSNMQLRLRETDNGEAAEAAAGNPRIRLFNVSREVAFKRRSGKLGVWAPATPISVREFSAAGYYFGVEMEKTLRVPIGLINSSYGGSQAEAWTPVEYLNASADLKPTVERTKIWDEERSRVRVEYDAAIKKWREAAESAKAAGVRPSPSPSVPDALRDYRIASSIYDRMVEPLIPFAVKGFIWYQGESNEGRAEQYGILLPVMIKAWRERWAADHLPFGIVQLPNYRSPKAEPEESAWSFIRENQRRTVSTVKNTGLITTIDIGMANDIHPKNKLDVGKRMANWALHDIYGLKMLLAPTISRIDERNGKVYLTFENVGTGLKISKGDRLEEFALAGDDKKWYWADAKITRKNLIEVSSQNVPKPKAVRYAFNSNPRNPNLTNDSGLPASPFRSDDWPDPTSGKR